MWFLLRLAARNLARNKLRTFITSASVVAGVALMILGWGLVDGLDENFLRAARTTYAGEVLLRPGEYPDDGMRFPLDESLTIPDGLRAELDKSGPWTARAAFPARVVKLADADRVVMWAYDEKTETKVFDRKRWTIEGRWPASGAKEIAAGWAFARLMHLSVGDEVIVEARTRAGAINALPYVVTGIVHTDNAGLDNGGAWMEMATAEELVQLEGARTHIAVLPPDGSAHAMALQTALSRDGWTGMTLTSECEDMLAINRIRRRALAVVVGMIMAIAATGIANTVIMAAYERVREIGTLLALGMPRSQVQALFLLEGAILGLVAGSIGATIGGNLVHYWQVNGFSVGEAVVEASGSRAVSQYVYTQFGWFPTLLSVAFGIWISVLASLWPAHNASRIVPAEAVRAD